MRYGQIVLLMMFSSVAAPRVWAQTVTAAVEVDAVLDSFTLPGTTPDNVVTRMMSFDRDGNGLIAATELPERMQGLIAQGDANHDGALDITEVGTLARRPSSSATVRGFRGGTYGFGDEVGVSSRSHIEGALEDLRLSNVYREQALAIVTAFMDALEADAEAKLIAELSGVLSPAQLAELKMTINRPDPASMFIVTASRDGKPATRVEVRIGALQRVQQIVLMYAVELPQKRLALAAVERYRSRLRPGDAERSALLKPMAGLLTDEERDNFRAALERRPLVKSNMSGVVSGIVGGPVVTER